MKTKFAIVVLAFVAPFVAGCGSSPENLLVGKWEAGDGNMKLMAEFGNDGKAKLTMLGQTIQGSYKVNNGDELEWTLNGKTTKSKVKVTETELEVTSTSDNITVIYKRE